MVEMGGLCSELNQKGSGGCLLLRTEGSGGVSWSRKGEAWCFWTSPSYKNKGLEEEDVVYHGFLRR